MAWKYQLWIRELVSGIFCCFHFGYEACAVRRVRGTVPRPRNDIVDVNQFHVPHLQNKLQQADGEVQEQRPAQTLVERTGQGRQNGMV